MKQIVDVDVENWKKTNPTVTEWGLALKQQGYKLGILSNIPTEFLDRYEKEIALFTVADYACFLYRVNAIKPEEAIFCDVIARLKIEPYEVVSLTICRKILKLRTASGFTEWGGRVWKIRKKRGKT